MKSLNIALYFFNDIDGILDSILNHDKAVRIKPFFIDPYPARSHNWEANIAHYANKFNGFIALGCVIKGETPHFDFISQAKTDAIMRLSIESKKPIGNGIITCLNMAQAKARSKKGSEATKAVLSVLSQK